MAKIFGTSVKEFGATGDGIVDDAPALQSALDAHVPRVVVPFGHYWLGRGLRVRSDTEILAHPGAHFRFGDGAGRDQDDFLITNDDHQTGNRNIRIEGGIWDGNNPGNPRGPDAPGSYSGVMMNFTNVDGLTLRAVSLLDAESYFVRLGKVSNFLIENIAFAIRHLRPNQDGIHVSGHCSDGVIRRLTGLGSRTPNDDMAALLADDALHRAQNLNGAFNGPIRRVRVEHLRASSCHSFVRLLSVDHPIEDIEINDVEGGCICSAINMDACRDCRVQLFDEADRPNGVGSITGVRASDFRVYKAADESRQPLIDFRTRAGNFRIERFERDISRDASPQTPTLCIERAGQMQVEMQGLSDPLDGAEMQPLATPSGAPNWCARGALSVDDKLTQLSGGFDRLVVSSNAEGG